MNSMQFDNSGELIIKTSTHSSKNDFDFLIGKWKVSNRKLKTRLNNCEEWLEFGATNEDYAVLNGLGNMDHFKTVVNEQSFEGLTIRLFNPVTKLWSIYWADSNAGVMDVPQVGSFENNVGYFYARDFFRGEKIIIAFEWDKTDLNNPKWSQAFSADNGKTWEWNWYMYFTRIS